MAKKKKLTKAERKEARLRKGKQWLITYTGSPKKMNKHYRERFHVDAVTAAIGVRIPQCFFRMASGKCCSYMSIEFAVRQIISGKDTITADFFHADNEIHSLPDQVCKGIKTFVSTVCHKDGPNRVRATINHCVKCRAFMKFLFPLHKEIAVGLIGDIIQCIDMNCIVTFLPSWMKVLSSAGLHEMLTSEPSQAKSL